jgi:branched-chain amino acid aminotransferase
MLASVDGAIGPAEQATIPVSDDGLLRGDGAFEVMRLYGGTPFALDEHFARLGRSCAGLRLDADLEALRGEAEALLEQAGPVEGLLRLVVTRAGRRIAIVEPLPRHAPIARVLTVRYAPNRVLDGLKTLSYAGNMLARRLATEQGYDEALLVTPHGRVLEGPTWTFFWVRDGRLLTPPLEDRILGSITRARILAVTDAREEPTTLEDLRGAEEAFIASTVREVLPIASIDDLTLPAAPGPVTLSTHEALGKAIKAEL